MANNFTALFSRASTSVSFASLPCPVNRTWGRSNACGNFASNEWWYQSPVRPRLYGEKLYRVEGSPAYPSYPGRANFSYISLQNLANRLHEKQKVGSARRVTRLAGLPFCDGRVTLLAGPTFLHINTLARLAGSTRSRETIRACASSVVIGKLALGSGRRVNFFLI